MKVIKSNVENIENEVVLLYKLTKGKKIKTASKLNDEELDRDYPVDVWLEYEDINEKEDKPITLLSIMSGDTVIVAQSATLQRDFFEILDIVGNRNFTIRFTDGKSNAGRRFMSCELVGIN